MTGPADDAEVRLRPVTEPDLEMIRRFLTEPFLIGLDWDGFRDAQQPARRFAQDGYLGDKTEGSFRRYGDRRAA